MKKYLASLTVALGFIVVPVSVANADEPCVTWNEYNNIDDGMRKVDVHDLLDTTGVQTNLYTDADGVRREQRRYPHCEGHQVYVGYKNPPGGQNLWRVWYKDITT